MQEATTIGMPLAGVIALSVAAGAGLALAIASFAYACVRTEAAESAARERLAPRMRFEVEPVPPALQAEYRRLYPLWPTLPEFARSVTDNASWSAWHDRVRDALRRYAAEAPGATLFVYVKRMPSRATTD